MVLLSKKQNLAHKLQILLSTPYRKRFQMAILVS